MKKTIAFILAMAMICSVVPVFADDETPEGGQNTVADAVYDYQDAKYTNYFEKEDVGVGLKLQKNTTVTFNIGEIKAGKYEIYYYIYQGENNAKEMPFTIVHNGKQTELKCSQENAGWATMGVLDFAGKGGEYFVHTNTGEGDTYSTELRLYLVGAAEPTAETKENTIDLSVYKDGVHPQIVKEYTTASGSQTSSAPATLTGDWEVSKTPDSVWVTPSEKGETVTYTPEFGYSIPGESGKADVFAHILAGYGDVTYTIKDAKYTLQPQKITQDQWVYLGNYDFSDGSSVILSAASDENISASTVAFKMDDGTTKEIKPSTSADADSVSADNNGLVINETAPFDDMGGHWAKDDVEFMASKGLVSGIKDNQGTYFDPDVRITRAEYITILDRALGYAIKEGESFSDVASDSWYAPYVATAKANGLTEGLPVDDGFKPNQPITREEMGLITYNAIKQTGKTGIWKDGEEDPWNNFEDIEPNQENENSPNQENKNSGVSPWAKDGLCYLVREGIIKGTSGTTISPTVNALRAEAAVILKRFMEKFIWAGSTGELKFNKEFGDLDGWNSSAENMNASINENTLQFEVKKTTAAKGSYRSTESTKGCTYWEVRCKVSVPTDAIASFGLVDASGKEVLVNEWHPFNKVQFHCYVPAQDNAKSLSVKPESDLSDAYHTFGFKLSKDAKTIFYYMDGKEIGKKTLEGNELLETDLYPQISVEYKGEAEENTTENAEKTVLMVDHVRAWKE